MEDSRKASRRGEKIGWIGGFCGGFVWLFLLSVVWLFQGKLDMGLLALSQFIVAICFILLFSPWRSPKTRYWKLLLPIYAIFFLSLFTSIWGYGGLAAVGLNRFSFLWIFLFLIPFATIGKRTWDDKQENEM